MKIVTASQMKDIDRITIEEHNIPGVTLMEKAGLEVAKVVLDFVKANKLGKKVIILAGKGNNGGDALVTARYLKQWEFQVTVLVAALRGDISGEAKENLDKLEEYLTHILFNPQLQVIREILQEDTYSLIVDGLLGTGIKGEVKGDLKDIIREINQTDIPVVAIDIPSGLDADEGLPLSEAVKAGVTVTMGLLKKGLVINQGLDYSGEIKIAEIGFPPDILEQPQSDLRLITEKMISRFLRNRKRISHKGDYGKIFILAGSRGFTGAAFLTCQSALRSGAGLVTLGIPESLNTILESKLTETVTLPLPETTEGSLSTRSLEKIIEKMKTSDVLIIGPGISTNSETKKLIQEILSLSDIPMVIDADGITAFQNKVSIFKQAKAPLIITPHPGEMARLINSSPDEVEKNRFKVADRFSKEFGVVTVLKGAATVITSLEEEIYLNLTGNPGMATAGSGDVLTGIIAGFLGGRLSALSAALSGVLMHGMAGDMAKREKGEYGLMATDILQAVPYVVKKVQKGK